MTSGDSFFRPTLNFVDSILEVGTASIRSSSLLDRLLSPNLDFLNSEYFVVVDAVVPVVLGMPDEVNSGGKWFLELR